MTLDLTGLRVGQLVSPTDAPGLIGFITDLTPTSDGRGVRITQRLIARDVPRRTVVSRVWPDDYATFTVHDPADYGLQAPAAPHAA